MVQAFSSDERLVRQTEERLKVLITGAAGRIGSYFATHNDRGFELRLLVHDGDKTDEIEGVGEIVKADITNLDAVKQACQGMDVVLHLAADPSPNAEWESILPTNIVGTHNVFRAAKAAGVRRVVYASSIHAVSGYPADVQVKPTDPVNPGDLYGVSKCFGEALGRYMAEQEGVEAICIRIGAFQPESKGKDPDSISLMDAYVSHRDLNQLLQLSVGAEGLRFAIFNGLSDNRFKRLDISSAKELLGYAPQDDLTEMNPRLAQLHLREEIPSHAGSGG